MQNSWNYSEISKQIAKIELPAMFINMDALDRNISYFSSIAEKLGKNIRIATKSIRVPELIQYIQTQGGEKFNGLMCYSVKEAHYLFHKGFRNLMVAYPTVSDNDFELYNELRLSDCNISLTVDSIEQIKKIEDYWKTRRGNQNNSKARLCIDVDMSWKPFGMHLGVYRSQILSNQDFIKVLDYILQSAYFEIAGVMGYEAQVAGMGDKNPFQPMLNPIKKIIKQHSIKEIIKKREEINNILIKKGIDLEYFNGGGTGSIQSTGLEPWITEIAVGSGFLQAHLFDYYQANCNEAALAFALQVSRKPKNHIVTCKSGGFIASGEISKDKMPLPFLPKDMKITQNEGFGEVQTPVIIPVGLNVKIGDALFFRPAKSGEIAEHFKDYHLIRDNKIVQKVKTYRGHGECFY
jgi:D-serine deaminase-like pyridoxal phosphate-dependent protein